MCGIAATFGNSNAEIDVGRMLSQIPHRGEDPQRIWSGDSAALGVRRLAIVDREGGIQPLSNENGTVLAVLNGEIYNHTELRAELEGHGHVFRTGSDTEVLVHGYEQWGNQLPACLEGMFAFVIAEPAAGRFLAARDAFGVKPLYVRQCEARIAFASEAKCLIDLERWSRHAPVHSVLPGHFHTQLGTQSFNQSYLPVERARTKPEGKNVDAALSFVSLVEQATRSMVQTNLPLGVLFGGGVDSGTILQLARRHHSRVVAIAAGLPGCEDLLSATRFCEDEGIQLYEVLTNRDEILSLIPTVVRHAESFEPNVVRNAVFTYLAARQARKIGLKVCLCGEGADELLCGYPELRSLARLRDPRLFRLQATFLNQLHRTQLQRVDRMAMAHTIEVRVPFLASAVATGARELSFEQVYQSNTDKWALRRGVDERGLLPPLLAYRRKSPISEGAGAGGNDPRRGMFFEHAEGAVHDSELRQLQVAYPQYHLKTKEEALYFRYFIANGYGLIAEATDRVEVNRR